MSYVLSEIIDCTLNDAVNKSIYLSINAQMKFETYAHKIVINYKQNLYRSMHTYAHIRNKLARTRRLVHAHLRGGNSIRGGGE